MSNKERHVFIVDDDEAVRDSMSMLLEVIDLNPVCFATANDFLTYYDGTQRGCLVLDIRMPGMSGLELQAKLNSMDSSLPIIFITGHGDIPMAVEAMRNGALDFMRKPVREQDLIDRVQQALASEADKNAQAVNVMELKKRIDTLTPKEHTIFRCVAEGQANKVIAIDMNVSERTIEVHRSQVMSKLQVRTLAQLVRLKIESERYLGDD